MKKSTFGLAALLVLACAITGATNIKFSDGNPMPLCNPSGCPPSIPQVR